MANKKIIVLLVTIGLSALIITYTLFNSNLNNIGNGIIKPEQEKNIKSGDIIFHTSLSSQSKAIQLATKSKYSHCGIIYREKGKLYVYEAVQPVKLTPLEKWIARGLKGHYVIKRLKSADQLLNDQTIQKMKAEGERFRGKDYDLTFDWSDEKIYCSELVWKIYKRGANIEIGKLQHLGDFDLSSKEVRTIMKQRYGNTIHSEEIVISPEAIFSAEQLETVLIN